MAYSNESASTRSPKWHENPRVVRAVVVVVALLFFALSLYYRFGPWPLAYRQQGMVISRAQLDALPTLQGADPVYVRATYQSGILVTADYPREGTCDDVLAHYQDVAPAHGWSYDQRDDSAAPEILEYYKGSFSGYKLTLTVDCDSQRAGYGIDISAPVLPI